VIGPRRIRSSTSYQGKGEEEDDEKNRKERGKEARMRTYKLRVSVR
jgi:hypothetical protein